MRRHAPSPAADRLWSATTLTGLLPLLAVMALLLGLVSLAHAQETTTDTSSDPNHADDPPVALQQNGAGPELRSRRLPADPTNNAKQSVS